MEVLFTVKVEESLPVTLPVQEQLNG